VLTVSCQSEDDHKNVFDGKTCAGKHPEDQMRWGKRAKAQAKPDAAHAKGEEPDESALKVLSHNTPIHTAMCVRCCMELGVLFGVCYEEAVVILFDSNMAALESVCDLTWWFCCSY
jgi:hypothetical protein